MKRNAKRTLVTTFGALALASAFFLPMSASAEMTVSGRYLVDPWGGWLTKGIRGINDSTSYPAAVVQESAKTGANCTRIYWKANDSRGIAKLDSLLLQYRQAKTLVMPSVWDASGKAFSSVEFQNCVNFWVNNKTIIQKYKNSLLLNIANEAGLSTEDFVGRYKTAITTLRNAGYNCPLVIDAPNWGRDVNVFFNDSNGNGIINAQELLNFDPLHRLVFSWHIYDPKTYRYGTKAQISYWIDRATAANLCFIVGEFSRRESFAAGVDDIEWQHIIQKCNASNVGWLGWEWYRSGGSHRITTTGYYGNWASQPWGGDVSVNSPYSIKNTSVRTAFINSMNP